MGVERDGAATVAVLAAHDQVGDRFEAVVFHLLRGHGVLLGVEAEVLQQLGGALGVRRVVAGRRVGGHLHQLLQELHFLVEVGVDPGVEFGVVGHGGCSSVIGQWACSAARLSSKSWKACTAS
ncbi:hypothetical protein D9M69_674290 [compost metagenome]